MNAIKPSRKPTSLRLGQAPSSSPNTPATTVTLRAVAGSMGLHRRSGFCDCATLAQNDGRDAVLVQNGVGIVGAAPRREWVSTVVEQGPRRERDSTKTTTAVRFCTVFRGEGVAPTTQPRLSALGRGAQVRRDLARGGLLAK